jgi:hypothetical protein
MIFGRDRCAAVRLGQDRSRRTRRAHGCVPALNATKTNSMGARIVRTIGIARARFKIGMMNLG